MAISPAPRAPFHNSRRTSSQNLAWPSTSALPTASRIAGSPCRRRASTQAEVSIRIGRSAFLASLDHLGRAREACEGAQLRGQALPSSPPVEVDDGGHDGLALGARLRVRHDFRQLLVGNINRRLHGFHYAMGWIPPSLHAVPWLFG